MSAQQLDDVEYRVLKRGDEDVLSRVASDVFDDEISPSLTVEFLADPRHHLTVAISGGIVVGFASAVHYIHPDKAPQLFINEVGVSPKYQGRGIASVLMRMLLDQGKHFGCTEAWVLTHSTNVSAMRLYRSVGGVEAQGLVMYTFPLDGDHRAPGTVDTNV